MDHLWDLSIVPLPDESTLQPLGVVSEATQNRSIEPKTIMSTAANMGKATGDDTSSQQPNPSTGVPPRSTREAAPDTKKHRSDPQGSLEQANAGTNAASSRKRARASLEPQQSAPVKKSKKDEQANSAGKETKQSDKSSDTLPKSVKAKIVLIRAKLAREPRPFTEYMSTYEGWLGYVEELVSIDAKKRDMTARELQTVKYAAIIRFFETLSLEMLEWLEANCGSIYIMKVFLHIKRTEKSLKLCRGALT